MKALPLIRRWPARRPEIRGERSGLMGLYFSGVSDGL